MFAMCEQCGMNALNRFEPLIKLRGDLDLSQEELAIRYGLKSKGSIADIERGARALPTHVAIRIFRKDGVKIGPIADLSDEEIDIIERIGKAA